MTFFFHKEANAFPGPCKFYPVIGVKLRQARYLRSWHSQVFCRHILYWINPEVRITSKQM